MNKVFFILTTVALGVVLWSDTLLSTSTDDFQVRKAQAELSQVYDVLNDKFQQRIGSNTGEIAPGFSLLDLNGQSLSLDQMEGKVVLLNLWASYCPACVHEMPMLEEVAQVHDNLIVIGINVGEHPDTVRNFMTQTSISYPIAIDAMGEVTLAYQAVRLPATWLISDQGQVIWKKFGGLSRNDIEFQLQEIENIIEVSEKSQGY